MKAVKKNNKHHESPRFGNIHHTSMKNLFITVDNTMNIAWNRQFHLTWWHFIQIPPKPPTPPTPPGPVVSIGSRNGSVILKYPDIPARKTESKWKALDLPPLTQASSHHQNDYIREFGTKLWFATVQSPNGNGPKKLDRDTLKLDIMTLRWVDLFFRWSIN